MNRVIATLLTLWAGSAAAYGDLPARMTACAQESDCCGVRGVCGGWVFVNARYGAAAQEEYRRMAMAANCAASEYSPAPAADCVEGRCASKPGSGGECGPGTPKAPATVAGVIEGLSAPAAGLRRQAAEQAVKLRAKATVPALIKALKENEAYWTTHDQSKNDMLGYEDLAGAYLEALTAIGAGAEAAVPMAAAMLGDERRGALKERLLIFLKSQGPRAAPALPALLTLADLGPGRGECHESLEVIAALGTAAAPAAPRVRALLPRFEAHRDSTGFKAALTALAAIDPGSMAEELRALGSEDIEILAYAIPAVGRRGPAAKAAVPGLLKVVKEQRSYTHLRVAAYEALVKIGAPVKEAAPMMLTDYLGQSDVALKQASGNALAKLDGKGEVVIPLLEPALESPFQVRDAVELLERMTSPRAAALAAQTRERWKLR